MQNLLTASGPVFSYHRPAAALSPYIAYYSVQHRFGTFASPQFLPDLGGSLIISWGLNGGQSVVWGPFTVVTTTGPQVLGLCARCFVEFRPGGLARLLYGDASELCDTKLPLEQINAGLAHALQEQLQRYNSGNGGGVAPKEYLRVKRVKQAAEQLRNTGAALEPLALQLRYYDTAHFVRDFQRILGVSPAQYRQNMSAFYNEKLGCL